jgi:hypothetical protein
MKTITGENTSGGPMAQDMGVDPAHLCLAGANEEMSCNSWADFTLSHGRPSRTGHLHSTGIAAVSTPSSGPMHLFHSIVAQRDDRPTLLSYEFFPEEETRHDQRGEVHGPSLGRKTTIKAREAGCREWRPGG